jgi:hypothetical protein
MRSLTRICLCLVALLSLAADCVGQRSSQPKKRREKSQQRTAPQRQEQIYFPSVSTPGPVSSSAEVRQVGQAEVRYHRESNETYVSVGSVVYEKPPLWMWLSFSFRVSGKEVVRPEAVEVALSTNGMAVFEEAAVLSVEADGRQFDFKPQPAPCFKQKCIDVTALVGTITFEQIANSRNVKIRAGRFVFVATEKAREAMHDLLKAVETPAKRP